MIRRAFALAAAGLLTAVALPVGGPLTAPLEAQEIHRTQLHDYRVVTVADGFEVPWSMTWLPNGDMLVTERPGRLRIVRDGRLLPGAVPGVPEVYATGQGGLLDVVAHPEFASNRMIYLSYSKPQGERASTTAVIRARFENDRLSDVEEIFEAQASGAGHYGGRIVFDGEGHFFLSLGDRQARPAGDLEGHPAQDLSNHHGVVVRLNEDGSIPEDNPFVGQAGVGQAGALPEIWSYGHRNSQGMAFHPETGELWATEHGPQGGDELNRIQPGLNYGWPVVGYGVNYRSGTAIHEGTTREGMEDPLHVWVPSIGTSGFMIYDGDAFPEWQGHVFAGGLSGERIDRIQIEDGRVFISETVFHHMGRVRDVRQGPDGLIYVALEARGGDTTAVVRLEPVN
ncbi:MAG TPA: PQQ-dependent sugar dehydrogenase [Longimicrobiales bacterium]|nr:PQQ-dependent sugar dehydrogenase [Longimicrobiales bacterium]